MVTGEIWFWPQIMKDQKSLLDEDDHFTVLTEWGNPSVICFKWQGTLSSEWPSSDIRYLCVHCNIYALMQTDYAKEADVPVLGQRTFCQLAFCPMTFVSIFRNCVPLARTDVGPCRLLTCVIPANTHLKIAVNSYIAFKGKPKLQSRANVQSEAIRSPIQVHKWWTSLHNQWNGRNKTIGELASSNNQTEWTI